MIKLSKKIVKIYDNLHAFLYYFFICWKYEKQVKSSYCLHSRHIGKSRNLLGSRFPPFSPHFPLFKGLSKQKNTKRKNNPSAFFADGRLSLLNYKTLRCAYSLSSFRQILVNVNYTLHSVMRQLTSSSKFAVAKPIQVSAVPQ